MPQYKLNYFDLRGRAEPARMMFHYAGVDFEDRRWRFDEWNKIKPTSDTGKSPWLEVDGKPLYETYAICRYLGTLFGLNGKDAWDNAKIDEAADIYYDFLKDISDYYGAWMEYFQGDIEALYKDTYIPARDKYVHLLEKRLNESGSGFFGSRLSWVDFLIGDGILTLKNMDRDFEKAFPKMVEYMNRVLNTPKIKEYIEKRKVTKN